MVEEGWTMGVTIGLVEPSTEPFSTVAVEVRGALASRVPLGEVEVVLERGGC